MFFHQSAPVTRLAHLGAAWQLMRFTGPHTPNFRIFADRLHRRYLRAGLVTKLFCNAPRPSPDWKSNYSFFNSQAVIVSSKTSASNGLQHSHPNMVHTSPLEEPVQHAWISDQLLNPIAHPSCESAAHCDRLREKCESWFTTTFSAQHGTIAQLFMLDWKVT